MDGDGLVLQGTKKAHTHTHTLPALLPPVRADSGASKELLYDGNIKPERNFSKPRLNQSIFTAWLVFMMVNQSTALPACFLSSSHMLNATVQLFSPLVFYRVFFFFFLHTSLTRHTALRIIQRQWSCLFLSFLRLGFNPECSTLDRQKCSF